MDYAAWLIHGDTGTGKTSFAGSVGQGYKTLYLYNNRNTLDTLEFIPGDRTCVCIDTFKKATDMFAQLVNKKHDYKCVVIDDLTQGIPNFRVELSHSTAADYVRASQGNYMEIRDRWRMLIKDYASLPMHAIFLAMSARELDELEPGTKEAPNYVVKPAVETKLRDELGGYLNGMAFTYKRYIGGQTKHFISFERGGFDTKLHAGIKIPQMEDPTFDKVWNLIQKSTVAKEAK